MIVTMTWTSTKRGQTLDFAFNRVMNRMSRSPPQLFQIHWRNFRIHFFFSFGRFRLKTPPEVPGSVVKVQTWCLWQTQRIDVLRLLLQVLCVLCCWLPQWIQEEPICPDRLTCSPTGTTLEGSSTTRPGCRLRGWRRWGFAAAYCCDSLLFFAHEFFELRRFFNQCSWWT